MEITPDVVKTAFYGVVAIAVILVAVAKAIDAYQKIKGTVGAENMSQNERLDDHETRINKAERNLDRDNERITKLENGQGAIMAALFALLGHATDGNNESECKAARNELQGYLIKR